MSSAASQLQALKDRGVQNPSEFVHLPVDVIQQTVAWWDQQHTRRSAGTGVLVTELRNGGRQQKAHTAATLTQREARYAASIVAFLAERFADLFDNGLPHPAAVAAVTRLHFLHGKQGLTAAEYDAPVRDAVEAWETRNA